MTRIRRPALVAGIILGVVLVVLIALPLTINNLYYQNLILFAMVLAIMAASWNITGGFAGYLSLGHSVFLGIGAYTTTVFVVQFGLPWWVGFLAAAVSSSLLALLFGLVTRRTRGVAYIIVTFAALELMKILVTNLSDVTNGSHGLSLPFLSLPRELQQWPFYYGILAILVLTFALTVGIRRSKFGAGLLSIREDEDKAASIGITTPHYKFLAQLLSGIPVGFTGAIYAAYLGFIEPRGMFSIAVSMQIVLAVLLGGRGTLLGPLLGAAIVEPLSQMTNTFVTGPDGGSWRVIIFGALLLVVILALPKGIIPAISERWERRHRRKGAAHTGERLAVDPEHVRAVLAEVRAARPAADPAAGPILQVTGISKRFGGVQALDDCSFEVERGSITGLIGPNGSGKTTAFNMIEGGGRPDTGEIVFAGARIDRLPRWERAHRGIGRTFQSTRLFPELTVRENLVAPLRSFRWRSLTARAMSGAEAKKAAQILSIVGLERYLDIRAHELSFGQQKLVELAQILMLDPDLVLLDEPAGGINEALIEQMRTIIVALRDAGTTFLVVEHNMPFVLSLCDTVHVLSAGHRIASGTPDEIRNDPAVLEAYLGAASAATHTEVRS